MPVALALDPLVERLACAAVGLLVSDRRGLVAQLNETMLQAFVRPAEILQERLHSLLLRIFTDLALTVMAVRSFLACFSNASA